MAKGENHQLLSSINRQFDDAITAITKGYEKTRKVIVTVGGEIKNFGDRVFDEIIEVNGKEIFVEAKSWQRGKVSKFGVTVNSGVRSLIVDKL